MKHLRNHSLLFASLLAAGTCCLPAQVPQVINYQGFIASTSSNATWTSLDFKFAFVNPSGTATHWSHDNTSINGSEPTGWVTLPVNNGLFSVGLGDTSVPGMSKSVPSTVFDHADVRLRLWVRDTNAGPTFELLSPDQRIGSVGYAMMAAGLVNGTVTQNKLGNGAVTETKLADGAVTTPKLADAAVTAAKVAPGAITAAALANGAVTSAKIATGAVSAGQLAAGAAAQNLAASGLTAVPIGGIVLSTNASDTNLINAGFTKLGTTVLNDSWQQRGSTNGPTARRWHTAVWTGREMLVWGGDRGFPDYETQTGGRYDPLTDTWSPISTNGAPTRRARHTAVWTGTEMIVWGGEGDWTYTDPYGFPIYYFTNLVGGGGRYNPTTDTWTSISTNGAPLPASHHSAVWTGTEMIIWGGRNGLNPAPANVTQIGGRYNPASDTWSAVSTNNGPDPRQDHVAVWTGTEMLVCSGMGIPGLNAKRYDPVSDTWDFLGGSWENLDGLAGVWSGWELITWGGYQSPNYLDTGFRCNPTNSAGNSSLSTIGSPVGRKLHTAVWTGNEMIVWGGHPPNNGGGRYNPIRDAWNPLTTDDGPMGRWHHSAVWTGREMLIWGGEFSGSMKDELWAYTPPRAVCLYLRP